MSMCVLSLVLFFLSSRRAIVAYEDVGRYINKLRFCYKMSVVLVEFKALSLGAGTRRGQIAEEIVQIITNADRNPIEATIEHLDKYIDKYDYITNDNKTPLYVACLLGNENVVRYLVDKMSPDSIRHRNGLFGATVLHAAVEQGHLGVVKILLDYPEIDINARRSREFIQKRFADGASPTAYGATPLFLAAEQGHLDVLKVLLDKGAKTETLCQRSPTLGLGISPNFASAMFVGKPEIRNALLGKGAAPLPEEDDDEVELVSDLTPEETEQQDLERAKARGDFFDFTVVYQDRKDQGDKDKLFPVEQVKGEKNHLARLVKFRATSDAEWQHAIIDQYYSKEPRHVLKLGEFKSWHDSYAKDHAVYTERMNIREMWHKGNLVFTDNDFPGGRE
jgi:hypothetical protein